MANGTICEFFGGEKDRGKDQVLVVPLTTKPRPAMEALARIDEITGGAASRLGKLDVLRDDVGRLAHTAADGPYRRLLFVSLGDREALDASKVRSAGMATMRWLTGERVERCALWIDGLAGTEVDSATAEFAAGMQLGGFRFAEHRAKDETPEKLRVRLSSHAEGHVTRTLPPVREMGVLIDAVNYARALAHQPANVLNPTTLADEARKLARTPSIKCTVLDEPQLRKLGMNGLLAVGQGAAHKSKLIRLEYKAAPRQRALTVLVGKAITFDTGGYSIKPAAGLEQLKFDKCGGMTVMGAIKAAADLKLKCNLVGLIAAAENAISDQAYRPGDILKMMSGKTVEVANTDAEGRLVLADALWYAQKNFKPTALIDLATLTGGVKIALGTACAGLMATDDDLAGQLGESGRRTGERLWRLPLWDDYRDLIKGVDSDIRNSSGKREAHCIVGGMFLKEFIQPETPWAHLDIANVATLDEGEMRGATGFGVRLLVDYLQKTLGVIATLLGLWVCGMLASLLVVQQSKVDWTWWRFAILLMMAAAAAMAVFAWFAEPVVTGGRAALLGATGVTLLGTAIWLATLLRTSGRPMGEWAGRIGPAIGLAGAACASYGFAASAGVVSAPPDVRAAFALAGMALVLGFGTNAAMLGHGYLTAKAMPIDPLRRLVSGYCVSVLLHGAAAALVSPMIAARLSGRVDPFWLAVGVMYGLVGALAPLMFAFMAWQAVRVRNTQSTTGIMYFAMVMNFIGALALCFLLRGR